MDSEDANGTDSGFVDNWQSGKTLANCNLHMLISEDSCDVNFRVGQDEAIVRAHRYVLMSRSCVFHAMLGGPLAEKDDIKITDVEKDAFVDMLKFLYTDTCTLTPENITSILYLSKKYAIGNLERQCIRDLESCISAENSCLIMEQAHQFDEKDLHGKAFESILEDPATAIHGSGFTDLCHDCFTKVIVGVASKIKPDHVFDVSLVWADATCRRQGRQVCHESQRLVLGGSIYEIPFTTMDNQTLADTVVPSKILSSEECLKLFCYLNSDGIDIAPFKDNPTKLESKNAVEVALYKESVAMGPTLQMKYRGLQMHTKIQFESNMDVKLIGFIVYANITVSDNNYEIVIKEIVDADCYRTLAPIRIQYKQIHTGVKCKATELKLSLSEPYRLKSTTKYIFQVTKQSPGSTCCYGRGLKSHVSMKNCLITVSSSSDSQVGLISHLILRECG